MPTLVCDRSPAEHRFDIAHERDGVRMVYALAALRHPLVISMELARSYLRRLAERGETVDLFIGAAEFVPLHAAECVVLAHFPPVYPEARS